MITSTERKCSKSTAGVILPDFVKNMTYELTSNNAAGFQAYIDDERIINMLNNGYGDNLLTTASISDLDKYPAIIGNGAGLDTDGFRLYLSEPTKVTSVEFQLYCPETVGVGLMVQLMGETSTLKYPTLIDYDNTSNVPELQTFRYDISSSTQLLKSMFFHLQAASGSNKSIKMCIPYLKIIT